jgi:hypothetical protein
MPRIPPRVIKFFIWGFAVFAIVAWVTIAGFHHWWRACLLTGLAGATFVIGALVGFVFTTYDEESDTIGKVKDWLIGSLAAITLVKFDALKPVLLAFSLHNTAADFALSLSVSIVFIGLGFFFMFFGRELLFNVPLARERAERNRVEAGQTSVITIQLLSALPSSILVGIDDAETLLKSRPAEAAQLKAQLWSDDVNTFLKQSKAAAANGVALDWDVVSKNGYLQYYRTYFVDAAAKGEQASCALQWVVRALTINPEHIDLTIKHADLLGMLDRNREAVNVLERLQPLPRRRPSSTSGSATTCCFFLTAKKTRFIAQPPTCRSFPSRTRRAATLPVPTRKSSAMRTATAPTRSTTKPSTTAKPSATSASLSTTTRTTCRRSAKSGPRRKARSPVSFTTPCSARSSSCPPTSP